MKRYEQPKGSITIEASIIVPLLLVFVIGIISWGMHTEKIADDYCDLTNTARVAAEAAYLTGDASIKEIVIPGIDNYRSENMFYKFSKTELYVIKARTFTGLSCVCEGEENDENGESVYVAENAEVYHLDRECSHLRLSIREVDFDELNNYRNSGGGKYKPCELCGKYEIGDKVYITTDGDRYHTKHTCSGLKRTVSTITESEAQGRGLRLCSRCGK